MEVWEVVARFGKRMEHASTGTAAFQIAPSACFGRAQRPARPASRTARRTNDWAPDLATDIGSARWFRGLGTLVALTCLAVSFWPDFQQVRAAPAMAVDDFARAELHTNTLTPLAKSASMGRRMDMTAAVVPIPAAPERARVELSARLGESDRLGSMLQRAGVGALDAERVVSMVSQVVPPERIEPGTPVHIALGRRMGAAQPRPLESLSLRARFDLDLVIERRDEGLVMASRPIPVDTTPLRVRGKVGPSLYRSARAAGAPAEAIQAYLRTLNSHISIEGDIRPSDEFDFVVSYQRAASGESRVGNLLYAGLVRDGAPHTQLLRWGADGQFYPAGGSDAEESGSRLIAPVAAPVTSGFGMRRHPILGFARLHAGMDFGAPWGAPIHAATDGAVVFAGYHGGHGNFVKLDHGGGIGTGYGHMSRLAVSSGERVRRGQLIGYVGSTGLSTGPHLHYELYRNGVPVNPASVAFVMQPQFDPARLPQFRALLARMQAVQPGRALGPLALR